MSLHEEIERALRNYVAARDTGSPSEVREFVAQFPKIASELLLRVVCLEFEFAWREAQGRNDNGPPFELTLKDYPELRESNDALLELVSVEIQYQPSQPSEENFVRRLPQIEALIRQLFALLRQQAPDDWENLTQTIRRGRGVAESGLFGRSGSVSENQQTEPEESTTEDVERDQTAFSDGDTVSISDSIEVKRFLEKGTSKWVFEALQSSTGRPIALKQLRKLSKEQLAQFVSEGQVQGRLDHQSIPPVFVLAPENGDRSFLLEKLISAKDWSDSIRQSDIPLERKLRILLSVSRAAEYAHTQHGIVHRDIKPQNVLVGPFGEVFLVDWGLAVRTRPDDMSDSPIHHIRDEPEGFGRGTPAYMPPEAATGNWKNCSPATDVFLLGAVLYEILCGHAPYEGYANTAWFRAATNRSETLAKSVPGELAMLTQKAMSRNPRDRFEHAGQFADAIEQFLDHLPAEHQTRQAADNLATVQSDIEQARKDRSAMHPQVRRLISVADQFRQARQMWEDAGRRRTNDDTHDAEDTPDATAGTEEVPVLPPDNTFRSAGVSRTLEGERSAREQLVQLAVSTGDLVLAEAQIEELEQLNDSPELEALGLLVSKGKQRKQRNRFLFAASVCIALMAAAWGWNNSLEAQQQATDAASARAEKAEADQKVQLARVEQLEIQKQAAADLAAAAKKSAEDNRLRLVERDNTIGSRELANDRLPEAIAWFGDAAEQGRQHPEWQSFGGTIRQRLSSLIRDYPNLDVLIPTGVPKVRADYSPATHRVLVVEETSPGFRITQWDANTGRRFPEVIKVSSALVAECQPLDGTSLGGPFAEYSPDGRWIAVAYSPVFDAFDAVSMAGGGSMPGKGRLRIYAAATGMPVEKEVDVQGTPISVVFSSDGAAVASVTMSEDPLKEVQGKGKGSGRIRIWNVSPNGQLDKDPRVIEPGHDISQATLSHDLSRAVTHTFAVGAGSVQFWDTTKPENVTPEDVRGLDGAMGAVLLRNGEFVAITASNQFQLRDFKTGKIVAAPTGLSGSVTGLAAGPQTGLITVSRRGEQTLFQDDGSGTEARRWRFYDAESGGQMLSSPAISRSEILTVRSGPQERGSPWLVTGDSEGIVRLSTMEQSLPVYPPLRHDGRVLLAELTHDGSQLIVVTGPGSIAIWDLSRDGLNQQRPDSPIVAGSADAGRSEPGRLERELDSSRIENAAKHVAISPDGKLIATIGRKVPAAAAPPEDAAAKNETVPEIADLELDLPVDTDLSDVSLWNAETAERVTEPVRLSGEVDYGLFSPDGRYLCMCRSMIPTGLGSMRFPVGMTETAAATAGLLPKETGIVWCLDVETGDILVDAVSLPGPIGGINFTRNSEHFWAGGQGNEPDEGSLQLWDIRSGKPIVSATPELPVIGIRTNRDHSRILCQYNHGKIQVWELEDGRLSAVSGVLGMSIAHADISADGTHVITSEFASGTISVWNLNNTSQPVWTSPWHPKDITALKSHPTEPRFLSASKDGRFGIWPLEGEPLQPAIQIVRSSELLSASWSPDGRLVATLEKQGKSQVFHAQTGCPVTDQHEPQLFGSMGGNVEFTSDSQKLIINRSGAAFRQVAGQSYLRDLSTSGLTLDELLAAAERVTGFRVPDSDAVGGIESSSGLVNLRVNVSPELLENEFQRHPDNYFLLELKARLEAQMRNHSEAVATLSRIIDAEEPNPSAAVLQARAQSYERLRKHSLAARDSLRGTDLETAGVSSLFLLARNLLLVDPQQALAVCDAIEDRGKKPTSPEDAVMAPAAVGVRSLVSAQLGDYKTGLNQMQQFRNSLVFPMISQAVPDLVGHFDCVTLGMHVATDDVERYQSECRRLVRDRVLAGQPGRVLWLARACRLHPEALEDWTPLTELTAEILKQQPDNPDAMSLHGQVLYRAGHFQEASRLLNTVLTNADKMDEDARAELDTVAPLPVWLALIHQKAGRKELAEKNLKDGAERIRAEMAEAAVDYAPYGMNWLKRLLFRRLLQEASHEIGVEVSVDLD